MISSNIVKNKYKILRKRIRKIRRNTNEEISALPEVKEANKFLKMMSDYKGKIRKIKKKIREEEGLN